MQLKTKAASSITGAKHPYWSKTGNRRLPMIDPVLPEDITRLTAIALKEVGKRTIVVPITTLTAMFVIPTNKHVNNNVNNMFVDQFM